MKTTRPSLTSSLLLSATHCVRRLLGARSYGLVGARAEILALRAQQIFDTAGHLEERYLVDALIRPATPDARWQLGELTLLPAADAPTLVSRGDRADDLCRVVATEVLKARRFHPASRTCVGTRRVRLHVRVRHGLKRICFQHRGALFGQIVLPGSALLAL